MIKMDLFRNLIGEKQEQTLDDISEHFTLFLRSENNVN